MQVILDEFRIRIRIRIRTAEKYIRRKDFVEVFIVPYKYVNQME